MNNSELKIRTGIPGFDLIVDGGLKEGKTIVLSGDKMPAKPTLLDFFTYRFGPSQHLLQSARLAKLNGCSEKVILGCLLHDISVVGFLLPDHGYWGAQMVAPYVDEEVAWAIKYHQALRYYADESAGYSRAGAEGGRRRGAARSCRPS